MRKTYKSIIYKYSLVRPSFIEGMARVLDIGGTLNPRIIDKNNDRKADYEAIYSDWENVGKDLHTAISQYKSLKPKEKKSSSLVSTQVQF